MSLDNSFNQSYDFIHDFIKIGKEKIDTTIQKAKETYLKLELPINQYIIPVLADISYKI